MLIVVKGVTGSILWKLKSYCPIKYRNRPEKKERKRFFAIPILLFSFTSVRGFLPDPGTIFFHYSILRILI